MADDSERYSVLLIRADGVPGGPAEVASRLQARFKLAPELAARLVASIPAVVKKDVGRGEGQRYVDALRSIGTEGQLVPYKPSAAAAGIIRRPQRPSDSGFAATVGLPQPPRVEPPTADLAPESRDPNDMSDLFANFDDDQWKIDAEPIAQTADPPAAAARAHAPRLGGASGCFDQAAFELPAALSGARPVVDADSGSVDLVARDEPSGRWTGEHAPVDVRAFTGDGAVAPDDSGIAPLTTGSGGGVGRDTIALGGGSLGPSLAFELGRTPVGETAGPGIAARRPSLMDELMAIGDEESGPDLARGFSLEEEPSSGLAAEPAVAPPEAPSASPLPEPPRPEPEPTLLGTMGNLDFVEAAAGAPHGLRSPTPGGDLELDTDNPRLTGRHEIVAEREVAPERPGVSIGGGHQTAKLKHTVALTLDPMAAEIERTLGQRTPQEAPRRTIEMPTVTGGFSAVEERSKSSTRRFVRWIVRAMALAVLTVIAAFAAQQWMTYKAGLPAKRFAAASDYFEWQQQTPAGVGLRSCVDLGDRLECRYSRELYAAWFDGIDPAIAERAENSCFGELTELGNSSDERIDCVVRVPAADHDVRTRLSFHARRECERSLRDLEAGQSTQCRFGVASAVGQPGEPEALAALGAPETVEFRRETALPASSVGELACREYVLSPDREAGEYLYFSTSFGHLVRRAALGGAASLRATFVDRGGTARGTQAWPR